MPLIETARAVEGRSRRTAFVVAAVAMSLLAGGCERYRPTSNPLPPAEIWVINGTTDNVRVRIDGEALGGNVPAGDFSFRFDLGEGARNLRVEPSSNSSLTGGQTVQLPLDPNFGAFIARSYVLATETPAGAVQATLMNEDGTPTQPGMGKMRAVHAAGSNLELDVWYQDPGTAALTRLVPTFTYGQVTPYVESVQGAWRVVVTPRMVPTPGENPEANILAELTLNVGLQGGESVIVFDLPGGGVRLVARPRAAVGF